MFKNDNEDDDLFLSDIGSLAQIYDKKQRFGKNFNPNYKKRVPGKPVNPYIAGDKKSKPFTRFDKHDRNSGKPRDDKGQAAHSKSEDKSNLNLYDDEDIQILPNSATENEYADDRLYDEFELNVKSNESPSTNQDVSTKNDAPWRLNRESRQEEDVKRLLEYERSFKNDELLREDHFQDKFDDQELYEGKGYTNEQLEGQAKNARSLVREQMKFDENYSKWAYDDAYDNEEKSFEEKSAPYDPEQVYEDNPQEVFNREGFSNPENPTNEELLDDTYPNMAEIPQYQIGKIIVKSKLEEKLRKDDRFKFKSKEQNSKFHKMINKEEDVIILDDSLITQTNRVHNEVNKKIKISFNTEHKPKPKSIVNESIFPDDSPSSDIPIPSKSNSGQKIPVLSRNEPPQTPTPAPTSFPPPVSSIPVMSVPRAPFPSTSYPIMRQNFVDYNTFGGPVINEVHSNNFIPDNSEYFANNPAPPGTFTTFPENVPQPPHGWIPAVRQVRPTIPTAPSMSVTNKVPNPQEPQKADKVVHDDAVKDEIRQQNKKLMDQRDQYYQKYNSLNEELNKLKKQKKTLSDNKKSHQAEVFLKENNKLQNEIQVKIKAVKNVIDMLSKIIKDDGPSKADSTDESSKRSSTERDESKESHKKKRKHSRSRSKSRHRSRSRSRSKGRRSRSHSHSRSKHRSRSRSRSRSHSSKRHRRRSRSRDKYYRRRRSHSKEKKLKKKPEKEPVPVTEPVENVEKEPPKEDTKIVIDRFKPSFAEVLRTEPKPKPEPEKPPIKFTDKPVIDLPINAIPAVPIKLVEKVREVIPVSGYIPDQVRKEQVNYVYFDPEIHWCRVCNVFPKTAKEYLLHLHAAEHKQTLAKNNLIDYPWHKNQPDTRKPVYPDASTERIPIRGLPFFVSASAWYCKLCNQWMGDLHCASAHLKSDEHEVNYMTFLESNPHWEEHWLDSRNKAQDVLNKLKVAETITPAYSSETYVKPTPVPPPPPPLQLREKKRSSSSSSSSSSSTSSSSSSEGKSRKRKKKDRRKERKRSVEKVEKPKVVITDAKKAREMAKKPPKPEILEKFESSAVNPEDDKFVQEWMNPIRSKSKDREFQELKNKLKKKEVPERSKIVFESRKKPEMNYRRHASFEESKKHELSRHDDRGHDSRHDERGHESRHDERGHESRHDDRDRRDDEKRSRFDDSRFRRPIDDFKSKLYDRPRPPPEITDSSKGDKNDDSKSSAKSTSDTMKKILNRPGKRFPFIGKMPSKNNKKIDIDPKTKNAPKPSSANDTAVASLPPSIKKTIEEYDRTNDANVVVVDMDINDDEDEPASIVVDDNVSRKKDFAETLKLLYPEKRPQTQAPSAEQSSQNATGLPPNITQDYLVSLIESTLVEKLKLKIPGFENQTSQIMELASSMKQALLNNSNDVQPAIIADIPIPFDDPTHITTEEQLQNVPLPDQPEVQGEPDELTPPGTADDMAAKKKKNPISQKKRKHLRKIREKLEEQEKLLQEKIEERKNLEGVENTDNGEQVDEGETVEAPSPPRPVNVMDSDLMMLGIDEGDSAALLF